MSSWQRSLLLVAVVLIDGSIDRSGSGANPSLVLSSCSTIQTQNHTLPLSLDKILRVSQREVSETYTHI